MQNTVLHIKSYLYTNVSITMVIQILILFQMTKNGDLIVRDLSFEDMGMFQCLVKNLNGHDMIETFVYPLAAS